MENRNCKKGKKRPNKYDIDDTCDDVDDDIDATAIDQDDENITFPMIMIDDNDDDDNYDNGDNYDNNDDFDENYDKYDNDDDDNDNNYDTAIVSPFPCLV